MSTWDLDVDKLVRDINRSREELLQVSDGRA
jgi:hypothetical protein